MQLSDLLGEWAPDGPGADAIAPPDDWRQGRTLYGGLTAALCVDAAHRHLADLPPLRSLQIAFVGPATGRVRVAPTLTRRGRSAAFAAVDVSGAAGVAARATLVFGAARDADGELDRVPGPPAPDPSGLTTLPTEVGPAFFGHFELRPVAGGLPFSGDGPPELTMWVRHRDDGPLDPEVALVAIGDVLPPALSPTLRGRRALRSVTWSLEVVRAPRRPLDWHLLRSATEQAADGYSTQTMGCWDRDGRILALGRQTVAVF